jgi:hypothetical protein
MSYPTKLSQMGQAAARPSVFTSSSICARYPVYSVVDPLISWSRYLDQLRPYFDAHLRPGWTDSVHELTQMRDHPIFPR